MKRYVLTSESVTARHPDKICDYIADSILDHALAQDPYSQMTMEAVLKDRLLFLYGKYSSKAVLNFKKIAKHCLEELGYDASCYIATKITQQPQKEKDDSEEEMVNQGMAFGYACKDTEDYMPAPIYYAHLFSRQLAETLKKKAAGSIGKVQVCVEYVDDKVARIDTIFISIYGKCEMPQSDFQRMMMTQVIKAVIPERLIDGKTQYLLHFYEKETDTDSGATGRKLVCDTYGGVGRIGSGCFSSKDPRQTERTAAYYCRFVAKNIVAHGLAEKCEIQVSYATGKEEPISLFINTFGIGIMDDDGFHSVISHNFSFKLKDMIRELNLLRPIYKDTSVYGHFGNNHYLWEQIKKLEV